MYVHEFGFRRDIRVKSYSREECVFLCKEVHQITNRTEKLYRMHYAEQECIGATRNSTEKLSDEQFPYFYSM
jgi:hypothetical protein